MRIEASTTSLSWIPSEAITSITTKMPFEAGVAHYDQPPPEVIEDVEELRVAGRFRFANVLSGWVEVRGGRIVDYGQSGGGLLATTNLRVGSREAVFEAVALPDLRPQPSVTDSAVTFFQTCGGRTGVPAPRRVRRAPFVQFRAPLAWTTLALTITADGSSSQDLIGASPFPRHWVYDSEGKLAAKSGTIDFSAWYRRAFGRHSPWGDRDSPTLTAQIETALERELSVVVMGGGAKPVIRTVKAGSAITEQGESGDELFLVLDGIVRVEIDGERIAEYGPGSLHGERAVLEGGRRTATVRAVTGCKVAVVGADQIARQQLVELSSGHARERSR